MFKSSSENAQLRARRVVLDSRDNSGGIDSSVFKPDVDRELTLRERLVLRKMTLQENISRLRGEMSIATSRRRNHQYGQLDDVTFNRLTSQFNDAKNEIMRIDAKLLHLRVDKKIASDRRSLTEAEVFVQVAREMLADPIFKRLMSEAAARVDKGT